MCNVNYDISSGHIREKFILLVAQEFVHVKVINHLLVDNKLMELADGTKGVDKAIL